ncbi:ABC transporter permease [Pseudoneobacillus rhizosphaerae]|jgi:peptide/nickel transport system permease protein|uniref:Glutathione transport system permease protein GsiC n=1 Tax=Pseudoneobacillus rhizosphaerae TaxID=2880968 RepID=A0A9C7LAA7_9BACI|nr:ABC transporter permease [Pseudoneobacillus rhizosphaerae]CAG9607260.1 Glutathione transport system permease protein GsiC [Pseudoneobacillus rhizosphaerae]
MSLRIFIVRRIIQSVPLLFIISIISYLLMSLAPGDVVAMFEDPAATHLATQLIRDRVLERLGLDVPIHIQYFNWLKGVVLEGNFGYSFLDGQPVIHKIVERIPATLWLTVTAIILSLVISIPIGVYTAVKRNSFWDLLFSFNSYLGISSPAFFVALLGIIVFSLNLGWLPVSGMRVVYDHFDFFDRIEHLILPASVLAFGMIASNTRFIRSSMLEVINQDYIQTARAKGVSEFKVIAKHALRNALLPIITVIAMQLPMILGGAFIIEYIFGWPGLGRLGVMAVFMRDYPIIMGTTMMVSVGVILCNLLADVMYAVVDPRIRFQKS